MKSHNHIASDLTVDLRCAPADRWHISPLSVNRPASFSRCTRQTLACLPISVSYLPPAQEISFVQITGRRWSRCAVAGSSHARCGPLQSLLRRPRGHPGACLRLYRVRNRHRWRRPPRPQPRLVDERTGSARYTATSHFANVPAGDFTTVGWPGFMGVSSAVAPERFAVTLNAVLSLESAQLAMPVVLLIRTVFEEARPFSEALARLSDAPLPCDCLLLLTRRSPRRTRRHRAHAFAVRASPSEGRLCLRDKRLSRTRRRHRRRTSELLNTCASALNACRR